MNITFVVICVFLFILMVVVVANIGYSIKQSKYVERKQDDQRKFNPIREKVWWRK